jgi:hypothetical protein
MKEGYCDCGAKAVWLYMPSYSGEQQNDYYCADCVPRGCSCNTEPSDGDYDNFDPINWVQILDEQGRECPCCEFFYIED